MTTMNRRQLLHMLGITTGSLFLPSVARAQNATPPKRVVVMFTQHGFVYRNFRMRPAGTSDAADFDVALRDVAEAEWSRILAPLRPFQDKLTIVDGLSVASAEADEVINEHEKGARHALTGKKMQRRADGGYTAGGPSIDQVIAQRIALPGRINSLEFAVTASSNGGGVWRDAGVAIPPDTDPRAAFSRIFPLSAPTEATPDDKVRRGQRSVLDLVARQYDAFVPRLSGEDRAKLELHRDLVRDVEGRLEAIESINCERPEVPALVDDFGQPAFYDTRVDAFAGIIAAALACDLTRVVTLQLSQLRNDQLGIAGDVHADFAHSSETNDQAMEVMTNYGEIHADHFRRLLLALDSVPEGNGTLLDNTLVVWCSELATGTHKFNVWPAIIGGGGATLRTGRYLRMVPDTPNPNPHPNWSGVERAIGLPHNRFWCTIANAAGANVDAVGEDRLTTVDGQQVDCTSPVDGMLV